MNSELSSFKGTSLRRVLDKLTVPIAYIDSDQTYRYVNRRYEEVFGPDYTRTTGRSMRDILGESEYAKARKHIDKVLSGKAVKYEIEIIPPNEVERPFEVQFLPDADEGNRVRGFFVFATEITDREHTRTTTHGDGENYRILIDNIPSVLWKTNREGSTDFISPNVEAVYGFTPREIYQSGSDLFLGRIHPDDIERVEKAWEKLFREQAPFDLEYRIQHKDGRWIWLHDRAVKIANDNNEPFIVGLFTDNTEKHRMQDKLRKSEEKYRRLTENARDMIYRMSLPDGKYEYVSSAAKEVFGYSPEEFYQTPALIQKIIHPDWQDYFREEWGKLIRGEMPPEYEYQIVHRSGEIRWLNQRNVLITDNNGNPKAIEGIVTDITLHKRAEEEKAKLEEQLLQAHKMEAIGRLAGGVAHDFNNILTGIIGYAEMIQARLETSDPTYTEVEEILQAGNRAAFLTSQLLAFSRKQVISPELISPNRVLENSQKMLHRIIGEDIDLTFKPSNQSGLIRMDPNQLDQVLVNLAVNARDAMPEGGKLFIETHNVDLDEDYTATHPDAQPGGYVMLAVTDNGHGMDPDTIQHIFEPFFSSRKGTRGTGLGLATVYGIVRQNNGIIHVYSEKKLGTSFKIYFPRTEGTQPVSQPQSTELPTGQETILLVEDDNMVRQLARRILEKQGYMILDARNSSDAFLLSSKHEGNIQMLLTDVIMPDMNGRDLHKKLLKIRPNLKVLFMSGYSENVIAHHGILEEGTEFLQKPFSSGSLSRKVRHTLDI
jgi:two-component system cell cycle sensor histidine kinase/response regulator CckA